MPGDYEKSGELPEVSKSDYESAVREGQEAKRKSLQDVYRDIYDEVKRKGGGFTEQAVRKAIEDERLQIETDIESMERARRTTHANPRYVELVEDKKKLEEAKKRLLPKTPKAINPAVMRIKLEAGKSSATMPSYTKSRYAPCPVGAQKDAKRK